MKRDKWQGEMRWDEKLGGTMWDEKLLDEATRQQKRLNLTKQDKKGQEETRQMS